MPETYSLRSKDRLLLATVAVLVCLPAILVEHSAGFQEAVLAQSLHEMSASGQWLVPTVGGLPWLNAPPLTQWFAHAAASLFGISNVLIAVRLAGMLPLVLATLWTASFAAACSGRRSGVLAGFVLLTTLGVAENVWHGGNAIWLVAAGSGLMNLLARLESYTHGRRHVAQQIATADTLHRESIVRVLAVFVLLGLSTLIAGPLAAFVTILVPAAGHVLLRRGVTLKITNPWLTGWLITATIAAAWPVTMSWFGSGSWLDVVRGPSRGWQPMTQLWMLAQISLPWLPFTVLGQWCLRHDSFAGSYSRERLLACWSISVPIAVFLLAPSSMNLAIAAAGAWSVSAAIGAERIANAIFKELPLLETRHNRAVLQNFLGGCAAVLTLSIVWNDLGSESRPVDQALLAEARAVAADGHPLLVDLSLGEQAAVLLVELDGLATPLSSQHNSDVPANSVVIS